MHGSTTQLLHSPASEGCDSVTDSGLALSPDPLKRDAPMTCVVRLHVVVPELFLDIASFGVAISLFVTLVIMLWSFTDTDLNGLMNDVRTLLNYQVWSTVILIALFQCSLVFVPDRISLSHDGIEFYRMLGNRSFSRKFIPWHEVRATTLRFRSQKIALLQFVTESDGRIRNRQFVLDRARPHNLNKLAEALRTFAPRELVADDIFEKLGVEESGAYTAIWLNQFVGTQGTLREKDGDLEPNTIINGKYRVLDRIGSGGQGTAYRVETAGINLPTRFVLKEFILPTHAGADAVNRAIATIKREFDMLSSIHSRYVVEVEDFFLADQRAYLVLEHIDGKSLRDYVAEHGAVPEHFAWRLARQMCEILQCLHRQNPPIIHRDFGPDNLILTKAGRLCLIDFTAAQFDDGQSNTTIVGKRSYAPPEQFRGETVPASDLYALGATLHFLVTGEDPEPITPSQPRRLRPELSDDFNLLVLSHTALDIGERWESFTKLCEAQKQLS